MARSLAEFMGGRRKFLRDVLTSSAGLLLAACGGKGSNSPDTPTPTSTPSPEDTWFQNGVLIKEKPVEYQGNRYVVICVQEGRNPGDITNALTDHFNPGQVGLDERKRISAELMQNIDTQLFTPGPGGVPSLTSQSCFYLLDSFIIRVSTAPTNPPPTPNIPATIEAAVQATYQALPK